MSAHTPGPWRKGKCHQSVVAEIPVPGIRGSDAVEVYGGHLIAESVATQNIPLIAAAPDLLEALQRLDRRGYLSAHACAGEDGNADLAFALAAIAKATGGAA
jgi:hypothetical protein